MGTKVRFSSIFYLFLELVVICHLGQFLQFLD
nr:MAG TPA: hypothetical protein [Caudoviricetes sp.]